MEPDEKAGEPESPLSSPPMEVGLGDLEAQKDHSSSSQSSSASLADKEPVPDYIVHFDGPDDPELPLNWPFKLKAYTTMVYALCTFGPQFSSSAYGSVAEEIAVIYGVSTEVSTLGVSLFLIG